MLATVPIAPARDVYDAPVTARVTRTSADRQREADLVAAMARGDRDAALSTFYQQYAGLVLAVCRRILGRPAEAEEVMQEVILELWRRAPDYDPARASVSTWVVTVARSRALDGLRARQRRGGDAVDVAAAEIGASDDRPDETAALGERQRAVRAALAELSAEQRTALELAYFEGLSHSEIAARLGQPLGTVKSRILTAMRLLRGRMVEHGGEAP